MPQIDPALREQGVDYVHTMTLSHEAQNAALCLVPNPEASEAQEHLGFPLAHCSLGLQAGSRAASSTELIPTCRHEQKEALLSRSHSHTHHMSTTTHLQPWA